MGFMPIAGEEFVFEAALSMLFHPNARGVPTWEPEFPGERIAVKIPQQFEWLKDHRGPVNREVGRKLATWAQGGIAANPSQKPQEPKFDLAAWSAQILDRLPSYATADDLRTDWATHRAELKAAMPERFAEVNAKVNARGGELSVGAE